MRLDPASLSEIREAAAMARSVDPDDAALLLDTIEGSSDALELLDACIEGAQAAAAMASAGREMAERQSKRAKRFEEQARAFKAMAHQILDAIGERKVIRPGATLSVSPGRLSVSITATADIPTQLRKPGEPDKDAIRKQIEAGETVPGAALVRGADTLTMRIA